MTVRRLGDEEKQLRVLYFSALFAPLRCNDCDIAPQRSAERRGCRCKNANSLFLVTLCVPHGRLGATTFTIAFATTACGRRSIVTTITARSLEGGAEITVSAIGTAMRRNKVMGPTIRAAAMIARRRTHAATIVTRSTEWRTKVALPTLASVVVS